MILLAYIYSFFFVITLIALAPFIKSIGWFHYIGLTILCPALDVLMLVLRIPAMYYNNLKIWGRRMEAKTILSKYKRSKVFTGLKIVDKENS